MRRTHSVVPWVTEPPAARCALPHAADTKPAPRTLGHSRPDSIASPSTSSKPPVTPGPKLCPPFSATRLPAELWGEIVSHLPSDAATKLSQVNGYMANVVRANRADVCNTLAGLYAHRALTEPAQSEQHRLRFVLQGTTRIDSRVMGLKSETFRALTVLDWQRLFALAPNVRHITIEGMRRGERGVHTLLLGHFPYQHITTLVLRSNDLSQQTLALFQRTHMPKLRLLDLSCRSEFDFHLGIHPWGYRKQNYFGGTAQTNFRFDFCPALQTLDLSHTHANLSRVVMVSLPQLRHLMAAGNTGLNQLGQSWQHEDLHQLQTLNLSSPLHGESVDVPFHRLYNLTALNLATMAFSEHTFSLGNIGQLSQLTALNLYGCILAEQTIEKLCALPWPNLRALSTSSIATLEEAAAYGGPRGLRTLAALRRLKVHSADLDGSCLLALQLAAIKGLTHLRLWDATGAADVARCLFTLPFATLHTLEIEAPNLAHSDFANLRAQSAIAHVVTLNGIADTTDMLYA